jgi:hypothetical protein
VLLFVKAADAFKSNAPAAVLDGFQVKHHHTQIKPELLPLCLVTKSEQHGASRWPQQHHWWLAAAAASNMMQTCSAAQNLHCTATCTG